MDEFKNRRLKALFRLLAETTIVLWGLFVCNFAQVFGGMLAFQDKNIQSSSLLWLLLPFITLFLCLPLTSGKRQKALLGTAIALPLIFCLALTVKTSGGETLLSRPIATLDALSGGSSLVELRRKRINDKCELAMYFCHNQASNINTLVRRETTVAPAAGLIWTQIVLKPSSDLFK